MKTITFFGHRKIFDSNIRTRLKSEIEKHLYEDIHFIIGTHGEFDGLALSVCRELRKSYNNIRITVVFTTLNVLKRSKNELYSKADLYKDVDTTIYSIEEVHFKRKIIESNKKMIENCDIVICYVDMEKYKSGAKTAIKFAQKQRKSIINLFREIDR